MANFLYLPDWEVSNVMPRAREYTAEATYLPEPDACTKCGTVGQLYRHGTKEVAFRDAPVHGKQVTIQAKRKRYRCRSCGGTFLQPLPDMDEHRRMTARCREYIEEQALVRPFTHVANDIGIDEKTVRLIAADRIEALNASYRYSAPRILGIDEVHLLRGARAIFTNVGDKRVLDLIPDRSQKVVSRWLSYLPRRERVEIVTIDMWRPYRDAVRAVMPKAAIVIDKFHVLKPLNRSMDEVRKAVGRTLGAKGKRDMMHGRFALLKRPENLTPKQALRLDGWLKNEPTVAAAYEAKEAFFGIWDLKTKDDAARALDDWRASLPAELRLPFKDTLTATKNWREEILAYWDHPFTNAYTEAANGILKMANRMGRGYTFDVIRARVLFGGTTPEEDLEVCQACLARYPSPYISTHHPKSADGERVGNAIRLCANCHRFHTRDWFQKVRHSTPKSE